MRRLAPLMAGMALVLTLGCYTDDVGGPGGGKPANPLVRVLLTDDPFPFDTLLAVNLYVVDIGASTTTPDVDSFPRSPHWPRLTRSLTCSISSRASRPSSARIR